MEKLTRRISMDIRPREGADPIRINVIFDMTDLTREQLADWVVNASSARVHYQNKNRPKGEGHLRNLAKVEQTYVLQPCGTKQAVMTAEELLVNFLGRDVADNLIEKFGSADKAKAMIAKNPAIIMGIEEETEETEEETEEIEETEE